MTSAQKLMCRAPTSNTACACSPKATSVPAPGTASTRATADPASTCWRRGLWLKELKNRSHELDDDMTPDELESSLRGDSAERFTEKILPVMGQEDKCLAKVVMALKRAAKGAMAAIFTSRHAFSSADRDLQKASGFEARIQLATLAFCPWNEARKVPSYLYTWGSVSDF